MERCVAAKATVTTSLLFYLLAYRGSALRVCSCNNGRAAASAQQSGARSRVVQRWSSLTAQHASSRSELDQNSTPLVDALAETASKVRSPLFYPGHKMGSGAPSRFVEHILDGKLDALRHDLPELDELDNLFAPEGAIRDAETLTAEAFGAAKTWLLANGSTSGVIASILACVQRHNSLHQQPAETSAPQENGCVNNDPGERAAAPPPPFQRRSVVILPRDAHKSAVHALVLSGATPCFLPPLRHPRLGMGLGIERAALEAALRDHGNEIAAVLLVSPTYEGACLDVESAAKSCHAAGIPLVVDEAHGAHLAFLGTDDDDRSDVPKAALQCGADLVVQSAHKTLGSLTQSALLHLGNGALAQKEAISAALAMVQSSSPSYLLLASLDAARWSLAGGTKEGKRRLEEAVRIVRAAREELSCVQGVDVVELGEEVGREAGFVGTDPLRLTVSFDGDFGGYDADDMLMEDFGVYSELPTCGYITFVFGPGSTVEHGRTLTEALRKVARKAKSRRGEKSKSSDIPFARQVPASRQLCTPREAYFRPSRSIAAGDAVGLASAETVCPYPPGIPALLPGEAITQEALDFLTTVKDSGGFITGCTDSSLSTIRVLQDTPESR